MAPTEMTSTRTQETRARIAREALRDLLDEPRNGANQFLRHPLVHSFIYTDGVREIATLAGAYWLLDIVATEVAPLVLKQINDGELAQATVFMTVDDARTACIRVESHGDVMLWSRTLDFTTFPPGEWTLFVIGAAEYVGDKVTSVTACLLSEN